MAKYCIVWDSLVSAILSEEAFSSLPHVLESIDDLSSSLILSASMHYRTAIQLLRNFIEDVVLQLYFCERPAEFSVWAEGRAKVPWLTRKGGVLDLLVAAGAMPSSLRLECESLFRDVSGYVHGYEDRLSNRGLFRDQWSGVIFQQARFEEWCRKLAQIVDFGIRVQRITTARVIDRELALQA